MIVACFKQIACCLIPTVIGFSKNNVSNLQIGNYLLQFLLFHKGDQVTIGWRLRGQQFYHVEHQHISYCLHIVDFLDYNRKLRAIKIVRIYKPCLVRQMLQYNLIRLVMKPSFLLVVSLFIMTTLFVCCQLSNQQEKSLPLQKNHEQKLRNWNGLTNQQKYTKLQKFMLLLEKYLQFQSANKINNKVQPEFGQQNYDNLNLNIEQQNVIDQGELILQSQCSPDISIYFDNQYEIVIRLYNHSQYMDQQIQIQLVDLRNSQVYQGYFNQNNIDKRLRIVDLYNKFCKKSAYDGSWPGYLSTLPPPGYRSEKAINIIEGGVIQIPILYVVQEDYHRILTTFQLHKIKEINDISLNFINIQRKELRQKMKKTEQIQQQMLLRVLQLEQKLSQLESTQNNQVNNQDNKTIQNNDEQSDCSFIDQLVFPIFFIFIVYQIIKSQQKPKRTIMSKFDNRNKNLQLFKFTEKTVKKENHGDWAKLVLAGNIRDKRQLKIRIKAMGKWSVNVGIVQVAKMDISNYNRIQEIGSIIYGSNCTFYKDSIVQLREGKGFQTGQIIRVTVDLDQNFIKWEVEGQLRYIYQIESNLKNQQWKFAIEIRGTGDQIQLIQ